MTIRAKPPVNGIIQIYAIPVALAAVSSAGLIAALMWDGSMDAVAGVAVAVPLVAAAWFTLRSWLNCRRTMRR